MDDNAPLSRPNSAPFLFGGLIGFVAGMAVAGVVAVWVYQSSSFRPETTPTSRIDPIRKVDSKDAPKPVSTGVSVAAKDETKSDAQRITPPGASTATPNLLPNSGAASSAPAKPSAGAAPDPNANAKSNDEPSPSAQARARLWLQVGAYVNPAEAETQRARFALLGYEATVITADIPEKGTVHRVRVGPYKDPDEMGKVRADLARQGIEVSVVKP